MGLRRKSWTLVEVVLALSLLLGVSYAQVATTQVTETVYHADGTAAAGTLLVSWPSFTAASGASVPAGSTSVTIGAGGAMTASLVPNAGATPMGSFYTVVYHLDDGSTTREYWVVPVSAYPVQVSAIKSSVLPLSVAMQTVSKAYVDTAVATAMAGHPLDTSNPYVLKAGDTMTGALQLPGDPTSSLQAADKQYVDEQTAALTAGLGQKVSTLPGGAQTVAQPDSTTLAVNNLNGELYASQYATSAGNDGIAHAAADADCASGCTVKAEPTYGSTEAVAPATWNGKTHVSDSRGGAVVDTFLNPENPQAQGHEAAQTVHVVSTRSSADLKATEGVTQPFSIGLVLQQESLAGGSNLYPLAVQGDVPYFKTTYSALQAIGKHNTLGQHVLASFDQTCYAVGDCLIGGQLLTSSGGFRDSADEGTHPFDLVTSEDARVFEGTCASGCTTGSTSVQVTATANPGTQGEGRYLIDTNPAKVLTGGVLTGGSRTDSLTGGLARQPSATFTGTSFPVSVLLETSQTIPSQANDLRPGTVTVAIATSSVPAGFQTNTAALPTASGVACVTDASAGDLRPQNYEMAAYTTVDGSHLSMTLNKAHGTGATIAVGGLCGYGLEQTVDTANGIRQVFPVVASTSPTTLLYAGGSTAIVGAQYVTSGYLNVNATIASVARSGNVVTVTTAGNLPFDLNGLTLTVAGVADPSFNGSFAIATTGPNTFTYSQSGANSTSTGGTAAIVTGGYALYPMAEVLSVYDTATKSVDGLMTLAANTVAWAAGDTVEMPHYFQELVTADTELVTQTTPRPTLVEGAGVSYAGNNGPGLAGWQVTNAVPATQYLGNGGTHNAPDAAYQANGVWTSSMSLQAGERAAFTLHCNSHGCGTWNSTYNLFELQSNVGTDTVQYAPTTSTLNFNLRGTQYSFSPTALTAGTINATTVNAGAINGAISAGSLPLFVASGTSHAAGAVPDPGPTPGTSRYLREDGTWSAPSALPVDTQTNESVAIQTLIAAALPAQRNLFDWTRALPNTVQDPGSGNTSASSPFYTSPKIAVTPGTVYTLAQGTDRLDPGDVSSGLVWYDASGNYLGDVRWPFTDGQSFTAPANAVGMTFSGLMASLSEQMVTVGSTAPSAYLPFLGAAWSTSSQESIAIQALIAAALPAPRNLFDKARALRNTVQSPLTGATSSSSPFYVSPMIAVTPGTVYTLAQGTDRLDPGDSNSGLIWYDVLGNRLSSVQWPFTDNQTFTAPAGAIGMTFSGLLETIDAQMVTAGSTAPANYLPFQSGGGSSIASAKVAFWGDDDLGVAGQAWQKTFFEQTGAQYVFADARGGRSFGQIFEYYGGSPTGTNNGGSGEVAYPSGCTGVSGYVAGNLCYNTGTVGHTLAQDISTATLGIVMMGTNVVNDYANLGAYTDSTTAGTLYGNIRAAIEGIQAANPNMKLMLVSPYQMADNGAFGSLTSTAPKIAAIVLAEQQVAADYGVPVLDLRTTSGFNRFTFGTMLQSDGIHPTNAAGFPRLGRELASFASLWY